MKKIFSFTFFLVIGILIAGKSIAQTNTFPSTGPVGIGTTTPNASSSLDVVSTSTGVLLPRMTRMQRNGIASPATGLLIFQTNNTPGFYFYDGTGWSDIAKNGANKSLNNLSATSVNVSLIPSTTNTIDLGTATKAWNKLYVSSIYLNSTLSLHEPGTDNFFAGQDAGNSGLLFGTDNVGVGSSVMVGIGGGSKNTATGFNALFSEGDGNDNTAIGFKALFSNDLGNDNTAIGSKALLSNTNGHSNVAIGKSALINVTEGFHLIAIGDSALFSQGNNSFAQYENVAVGSKALFTNDDGSFNTAVGNQALFTSDIGHDNCSFGYQSLFSNTNGSYNVAVGNAALHDMNQGDFNTAVGTDALSNANSATSNLNSALGNRALYFTTTGDSITACGAFAGDNNTTGTNNTFLGADADATSGTLSNASAVGYGARVTASNNMVFGKSTVVGWGFGVAPAARAIKVGTSPSNGNAAFLTLGGVWTDISDRSKKENITRLDKSEVLKKINQLDVSQWKYTGTKDEYHIGPMADDFHKLFEVGDDSSISSMDKTGVLFLGVQALSEENGKLKIENGELKSAVGNLKSELDELKSSIENRQLTMTDGVAELQTSNSKLQTPLLGQNIPNPFDNSTLIPFRIPKNCHDASIMIVETGTSKVVTVIPITCDETHVQIDAGELAGGVYTYTLYVDGKMIDTKSMELVKK